MIFDWDSSTIPEIAEKSNIWYYLRMIARIEGTIVHVADKFLIVDVSGVGYKLYVTTEAIGSSKLGDHTSFLLYTSFP